MKVFGQIVAEENILGIVFDDDDVNGRLQTSRDCISSHKALWTPVSLTSFALNIKIYELDEIRKVY